MALLRIWQRYPFGRLNENNEIEYFRPHGGGLKTYKTDENGNLVPVLLLNPSEASMNAAGWYRVVNVEEDGTDIIIDNILYHYTGSVEEGEGEE